MIYGTSTIARESASCYFVSYVVLFVLTCINRNKYPCCPTCDCRLSENHKLSTQHCSFAHALPDK